MTDRDFKKYIKEQTFNVYEIEYEKSFIDKLPIKWEIWKNQDLTAIPEIYHVLWKTDWNWGQYSKMDIDDRIVLHDLWLEFKHWELDKTKTII